MTLQQINSFDTDDPDKLSRQLSDFEDHVHAEFVSTGSTRVPMPAIRTCVSAPGALTPPIALIPDSQTSFDTASGNLSAVLPPLSAENFGRRFIVVKRVAANTITVTCQSPNTKVNGVAFPRTISNAGFTVFFCDSAGYYG